MSDFVEHALEILGAAALAIVLALAIAVSAVNLLALWFDRK
jgi:hypothetical protein